MEDVERKGIDQFLPVERLITENADIPVLKLGPPLGEAESAAIFVPGIGVPSYDGKNGLESYYLLAAKKLKGISTIGIVNWPGNGEGRLLAKTESSNPQSLALKEEIIESLLDSTIKYSNLKKIYVFAHSTAAGVVLRNASKLIGKDPRVHLIVEDPSGVGYDSIMIKAAGKLAKIGLLTPATKIQQSSKDPRNAALSSYGPFPENDEWPVETFTRASAREVQEAMRAEAKAGKFSWKNLPTERIVVTRGEFDPMVTRKIALKCGECGIPYLEIPGAGHLSARSVENWYQAMIEKL